MNSKREAKKVLKAYGKALYKSRIEYAASFSEEEEPLFCTTSYRHMMKRSLVIVLVLIMTLSLLVIGANALGIKFLNLSFFEKNDRTVVTKNENTDDTQKSGHGFYKPGYIPPGYSFEGTDEFKDLTTTYSYINDDGEYLTIDQSKSDDDFHLTIDNEDCEIRQDTIEDMEVRIYKYHDTNLILVLLKKEDIYIQISGPISEKEARKIVQGLF